MLELPEYKESFMLCPEFEWKWYRWHRYFQMFQSVCPLADVRVQFYLNSTRVALHDSRLKILSILCLKQAFFSASPFRLASFYWLPLSNNQSCLPEINVLRVEKKHMSWTFTAIWKLSSCFTRTTYTHSDSIIWNCLIWASISVGRFL